MAENTFQVRPMEQGDYSRVYGLWKTMDGFALRSVDDSEEKIRVFLERNPGISVVAEVDDRMVGAVLCGHDGRRGCLYHVCVDRDYRQRGIGRAMVGACMEALKRENINGIMLSAFVNNQIGNVFWHKMGWRNREDLRSYELVLNPENRIEVNQIASEKGRSL